MQTHFYSQRGTTPILLHIPHSSVHIPAQYRSQFALNDKALQHEARWMADLFTDELFTPNENPYWILRSDISRIVVDMERFENDDQEEMTQYGMGAVYTQTSTGATLKSVTEKEKSHYIENVFRPYHHALEELVRACIQEFGHCTIIDCHSFPSTPRYYEDQTPNRPDICLGTVSRHTPEALSMHFEKTFTSKGLRVAYNTPFAGSILPTAFMHTPVASNISTIMLEVNRSLYIYEKQFKRNSNFERIQRTIQNSIQTLPRQRR